MWRMLRMDSIKIDNSSCIFVKISITGLTKTEEIWDGIGLVIDGRLICVAESPDKQITIRMEL